MRAAVVFRLAPWLSAWLLQRTCGEEVFYGDRAWDPRFGDLSCDDEPEPELHCAGRSTEFVRGAVYGCEAAWAPSAEDFALSNDAYSSELGHRVCGSDFHVCNNENEARFLGLTEELCATVPEGGDLFLSMQSSGGHLPGIFGCASRGLPGMDDLDAQGNQGELFNGVLTPGLFGAWSPAEGFPEDAEEARHWWQLSRVRKGDGGGGLLCCRLPRWRLFRDRLTEYLSVGDLAHRVAAIPGLMHKVQTVGVDPQSYLERRLGPEAGGRHCVAATVAWWLLVDLRQCEIYGHVDDVVRHIHKSGEVEFIMHTVNWPVMVASGWPLFGLLTRLRRCVAGATDRLVKERVCEAVDCAVQGGDLWMLCCCGGEAEARIPLLAEVCGFQSHLGRALAEDTSARGEWVSEFLTGLASEPALEMMPIGPSMAHLLRQPWDETCKENPHLAVGISTTLLMLLDALRFLLLDHGELLEDRVPSSPEARVINRAQQCYDVFRPKADAHLTKEDFVLCDVGCWPLMEALDRLAQLPAVRASTGDAVGSGPRAGDFWIRVAPGRDITSDSLRVYRKLWGVCPRRIEHTVRELNRSGREVRMVEVGASALSCGFWARMVLGSRLKGLLVEPNDLAATSLEQSLRLNGLGEGDLTVVHKAAADAPGKVMLFSPSHGAALSSLDDYFIKESRGGMRLAVDVEPLDSMVKTWLSAQGLSRESRPEESCAALGALDLDFVIVNAQGSEYRVLKGAYDLLECRAIRTWAIKVYAHTDHQGYSGDERRELIIQLLISWAYAVDAADFGSSRFLLASRTLPRVE